MHKPQLIVVIGRGHGGTRAIARTLQESGVFMGEPLNESYDLIPPDSMYEANCIFAQHVKHLGSNQWDMSAALALEPPAEFVALVEEYLKSVLKSDAPGVGWKLPQTVLCFPWIVKMFPDAYYIHWVRDIDDACFRGHPLGWLKRFGIESETTADVTAARRIQWHYNEWVVATTPQPENFITIRFEDFVCAQDQTLKTLEQFLQLPLVRIPVDPKAVGRFKRRVA